MRTTLQILRTGKGIVRSSYIHTVDRFPNHMAARFFSEEPKKSSKKKRYIVRFSPALSEGSKIVIPVSMGRYNLSKKAAEEYDNMLSTLFNYTASLLHSGLISQVDVISTADLQRINWDDTLTTKIERHFFHTHAELLAQQSNQYKWKEWINIKGEETFEENYKVITEQSAEGTEWNSLMVKTHNKVKMSSNLENSLEYQRREYAAVMLMGEYKHLVYTGPISLAWAYMYHVFNKQSLPTFTRAAFENYNNSKSAISISDANHTTQILLSNIEQTLTSPNFPKNEKEKLINAGLSLFYAYEPKSEPTPKSKSDKKNEETLKDKEKTGSSYHSVKP